MKLLLLSLLFPVLTVTETRICEAYGEEEEEEDKEGEAASDDEEDEEAEEEEEEDCKRVLGIAELDEEEEEEEEIQECTSANALIASSSCLF